MKIKKKNKILNSLIIILIFILAGILIFKEQIGDLDELWQYNFATNIANGLIPYKDFNMVSTPFFPFLASIFLTIFSNQLIVMRIFNTLVFAGILAVSYNLFRLLKINNVIGLFFTLLLYFLFYYDLGVEYNYLILLITLITLYIELYNTEKYGIFNSKYDFWIGMLIGSSIITKHTSGIIVSCVFIFYKLIFIKEKNDFKVIKKIIIYRLLGVLVPCIIFLVYLLLNNALSDFISYAILGISEFSNKVSYFNLFFNKNLLIVFFSFTAPIILMFFIGMCRYRNHKKNSKIITLMIFSISMFIGTFPIANSGHFIIYGYIGIISTLYLVYHFGKKIIKSKTSKIFIINFLKLFIILFIALYIKRELSFIFDLYKTNTICKNELEHYYGIVIDNETICMIQNIDKFIIDEKEKNNKVLILDSSACFFNIPIDIYNKDYDMFNKGNFGKNGENRIIKEISEAENIKYLILKENYSKNWQTPLDIIDYVKNNKVKIGEIEIFDVYQ